MDFATVGQLFCLIGIGFPFSFMIFSFALQAFEETDLYTILKRRLFKNLDE